MATRKTAPKSPAPTKTTPRNLAPKSGTKVKGGLAYKLENVRITSYQLG
jgi:hypothetical protein